MRSQSDEGMAQPGESIGHDQVPTANSFQLQVDPQDIHISESEDDEPMTVDAEEIEVIDISINEEDKKIEYDDLI